MSESTLGGPVSAALEAELRGRVREQGLIVWLDLDDHYAGFVGRLVAARDDGELPYDVLPFRGSHLELMLALDGKVSGTEKPKLVVHLPGFNEVGVRDTPLLSVYAAGVRWRKAPDTLLREAAAGRVHPDDVERFLAEGDVSIESSDRWLESALRGDGGGADSVWRSLTAREVMDRLIARTGVDEADADPALSRLRVALGIPDSWRERLREGREDEVTLADVRALGASWSLAVEYVDDLRRAPLDALLADAVNLPASVVTTCRGLAAHLRAHHPGVYESIADETQAVLDEEFEHAIAEDLGEIDTFRFEEERLLEAALLALGEGRWTDAREWAARRVADAVETRSHWLRQDVQRRSAWELIGCAAALGAELESAAGGPGVLRTHEDAVRAYVERGATVDRAHRVLEQQRVQLLVPQVPGFGTLRARLDELRVAWEQWADAWAVAFNALCRREGFLPPPKLQQRTIFDDVVGPLSTENGTTAYFLVDALRYEMAVELLEQIEGSASTTAHLDARLAELPTATEVGMNVLAPVQRNGRLEASLSSPDGGKFTGFSTGQFRVHNPATRKRAIHDRVGARTCPWLELREVVGAESKTLRKQLAGAPLVVVHSIEIDDAGEKGAGRSVFDDALRDLRTSWTLLRQAGVRRFVITSDHGFLLRYGSAHPPQRHGRPIDVYRRHVVTSMAADVEGTVRVALRDLGYDGVDAHLVFPETTNVFDRGKKRSNFVHGGNSLQERVIPVLTIVHRAAAGSDFLEYRVSADVKEGVAGLHCVEAEVSLATDGALAFAASSEVELVIAPVDAPDVQVELVQVRDGARLERGAILARVGERFEAFFRLSSPDEARVALELRHAGAGATVEPCRLGERFDVAAGSGRREGDVADSDPSSASTDWLDDLPSGGVRDVFRHLDEHGTVTEDEATRMLGGPRKLRRFAREFEEHAKLAPFRVRIRVVANVKRYVREGNE